MTFLTTPERTASTLGSCTCYQGTYSNSCNKTCNSYCGTKTVVSPCTGVTGSKYGINSTGTTV